MQRRDFVKIAPAVMAAGLPLTARAETSDEGPVIVWNRGEPLLEELFPEAVVRVYKNGLEISNWTLIAEAEEKTGQMIRAHHPDAGVPMGLDSSRRVVRVIGLDGDLVDITYDAMTVTAPHDVIQAMHDANVLPRHWVKLIEPCLRIVARERVVLEKSGRTIEKIVVSLPVSKADTTTTPFGSGFMENGFIWYKKHDGQLRHEEGYPDDDVEVSPDNLLEELEDGEESINGWIELQWTDGMGHLFLSLGEGETLESQLSPTRPARVVDLTRKI